MAKTYILEQEQDFSLPREELFEFFADAGNLSAITPRFLDFRILTPMPVKMHTGARLDYRLKLFGLPFRWKTRIDAFSPASHFVDRQVAGPYRLWHHTHTFEDVEGGTRMRDLVRYRLPYGPIGRVAHALLLRRTLRRIFNYRRDVLRSRFPPPTG